MSGFVGVVVPGRLPSGQRPYPTFAGALVEEAVTEEGPSSLGEATRALLNHSRPCISWDRR